MRSNKRRTARALAKGYLALVAKQQDFDWPYPGQSYFASDSAADERWEYWHNASTWYAKGIVKRAQRLAGV